MRLYASFETAVTVSMPRGQVRACRKAMPLPIGPLGLVHLDLIYIYISSPMFLCDCLLRGWFKMSKVKDYQCRIIALLLCVICIACFYPQSAAAATSGTSGSATITVKTKAVYYYPGSSSITLKQSKQTLTYKNTSGTKTKTKTGYYGCYTIKVKNCDTGKTKSYTWNKSKSKKISLSKNTNYQITVTYSNIWTSLRNLSGYKLVNTSTPSWKVSSTWKVSSCS